MIDFKCKKRLAFTLTMLLVWLTPEFIACCTPPRSEPIPLSSTANPTEAIATETSTPPPTATITPTLEPTQTTTLAPAMSVKLLSYNILYGAGVQRSFDRKVNLEKRTNRLPKLLDMLKQARPDLVGIQEAAGWDIGDPPIVKQVADELGMEYYFAKSATGDLHTVLLSRFPIDAAENLSGWIGEHSALYARVITPDRKPLNVFVVQLNNDTKPYGRACQAKALLRYMAPYSNQRSVLMGDFSSGLDDESSRIFDQSGWKAVEYGQLDQIRAPELTVWEKSYWHPFKIVELSSISDHPPMATQLQFYNIPGQPTVTPLPPVEVLSIPDPVNRYLKSPYVKYSSTFTHLDECYKWFWKGDWRWITASDAGLIITGKQGWQTKLDRQQLFSKREGVLLKFKVAKYTEANIALYAGVFSTNNYRRWGVALRGKQIRTNLYLGPSNVGGSPLEKNFELQEDTWYNLLLAVGDQGTFLALIWDAQDPNRIVSYYKEFGSSWEKPEWRFLIEANSDKLWIQDFQEVRFSTISEPMSGN